MPCKEATRTHPVSPWKYWLTGDLLTAKTLQHPAADLSTVSEDPGDVEAGHWRSGGLRVCHGETRCVGIHVCLLETSVTTLILARYFFTNFKIYSATHELWEENIDKTKTRLLVSHTFMIFKNFYKFNLKILTIIETFCRTIESCDHFLLLLLSCNWLPSCSRLLFRF